MDSITGSAGTVKTLFEGLKRYGVSPRKIKDITGIKIEDLVDSDLRIPISKVLVLAKDIGELTGIPSIGLKLGTDPAVIYPSGIAWGIMSNSERLEEGIKHFSRYIRIISEFLSIEFKVEANQAIVEFQVDPIDYYTVFSMEILLSRFITTIRQLLDKKITPFETGFLHDFPDYIDEYKLVFGDKVLFNQKTCFISLPKDLISLKITHRDSYLETFLTKHAEELLSELNTPASFMRQVKNVIIKQLYNGKVDVEYVSQKLNMSRSTLFRKLKEEGLTFKDILRDTRRELSRHYLMQDNLTISEIAFLLGFNDPSSFNKAFKKWEKKSPLQYRQQKQRSNLEW